MFFAIYQNILAPFSRQALLSIQPLLSEKMKAIVKLREARPWRQQQLPKNALIIHASSGELEYAKPLILELNKKYPGQKIILTYFSPSTLKLIKNLSVDALVPLPWDTKSEVNEFLSTLEPKAVWISRTDLWPQLLKSCQQREIPTLLFSASFKPPTSWLQKRIKKWMWSLLSEISFVSPKDLDDFKRFSAQKAFCDGNTRVDQVLQRLSETRSLPLERFSTKPVIVLGSLWPDDIKVWLKVIKNEDLERKFQWIWVPHEIDSHEIKNLHTEISQVSRSVEIWTETRMSKGDHLIVNAVGFLAEIYQMGNLAFVGGSFVSKVHSLLEPLAAGIPVIVGPHFRNQPEAESFAELKLSPDLRAVTWLEDENKIAEWLRAFPMTDFSTPIRNRLALDRGATARLLERHLLAGPLKRSSKDLG